MIEGNVTVNGITRWHLSFALNDSVDEFPLVRQSGSGSGLNIWQLAKFIRLLHAEPQKAQSRQAVQAPSQLIGATKWPEVTYGKEMQPAQEASTFWLEKEDGPFNGKAFWSQHCQERTFVGSE